MSALAVCRTLPLTRQSPKTASKGEKKREGESAEMCYAQGMSTRMVNIDRQTPTCPAVARRAKADVVAAGEAHRSLGEGGI